VGSVRLDLAEPHLIVPANTPPDSPHVLLPYDNALQAADEEAHLSTLMPWLRPEGEGWIYLTLHEVVEQAARTTRTVVEVRVNGSVAGKLTPKMSGEYLPAIRLLAEQGTVAAARAIVKGNRIKADIVLHAARANQLSAEWLDKVVARPSPAPAAAAEADFAPTAGAADLPALAQAVEETVTWRFNPPPCIGPSPGGWWRPPRRSSHGRRTTSNGCASCIPLG
jgi:collagen type III alpha